MINNTPKTKILILLLALFAIANIALLVFVFGKRPVRPGGRMKEMDMLMKNFLQKDLGFSEGQMAAYDSARSLHKKTVRPALEKMRSNREANLRNLGLAGFSDSALAATVAIAGAQQQQLEQKMLQHLQQVRSLCSPEQRAKFDSGFYKVFIHKDKNKIGNK